MDIPASAGDIIGQRVNKRPAVGAGLIGQMDTASGCEDGAVTKHPLYLQQIDTRLDEIGEAQAARSNLLFDPAGVDHLRSKALERDGCFAAAAQR